MIILMYAFIFLQKMKQEERSGFCLLEEGKTGFQPVIISCAVNIWTPNKLAKENLLKVLNLPLTFPTRAPQSFMKLMYVVSIKFIFKN